MSTITWQGRDGAGNTITFNAEQLVSGGPLTPHTIPQVDGLPVAADNRMPVAIHDPMASIVSTALEAARVLLNTAGTVHAIQAYTDSTGWVMLLDAAAIPPDGAVTPRKVWRTLAAAPATIDHTFTPPLAMTAGAILVFSTTGPFVKTSAATAFFSAEVSA